MNQTAGAAELSTAAATRAGRRRQGSCPSASEVEKAVQMRNRWSEAPRRKWAARPLNSRGSSNSGGATVWRRGASGRSALGGAGAWRLEDWRRKWKEEEALSGVGRL